MAKQNPPATAGHSAGGNDSKQQADHDASREYRVTWATSEGEAHERLDRAKCGRVTPEGNYSRVTTLTYFVQQAREDPDAEVTRL